MTLRVEGLEDRTVPTAGTLDDSFGVGGKALLAYSSGADSISDIVLLDGQKTLVAGSRLDATGRSDFLVGRLTATGQRDTDPVTGFGPHVGGPDSPRAGFVTIDFGSDVDEGANAVAVDGLGRIVVGGSTVRAGLAFALARLAPDGSLDETFGTAGKTVNDLSASSDNLLDLAVMADGRVVAVGYANNSGAPSSEFATVVYSASGSLVPSLGIGWVDIHGFGDNRHDVANAVTVQGDGRIVVGGTSYRYFAGGSRNNADLALLRYEPNGGLDPAFTNSVTNLDFLGGDASNEGITDLAVLPDGRIAAAGFFTFPGSSTDFLAASLTPSGIVERFRAIDFGNGTDWAEGLAVQPDGKVIAAGWTANTAGQLDAAAVRLNTANGNLDLDDTFGDGGKVRTDFGTGADQLSAVAVQANGRIVVAGRAGNDSALARYEGDDAPVPDNQPRIHAFIAGVSYTSPAYSLQGDPIFPLNGGGSAQNVYAALRNAAGTKWAATNPLPLLLQEGQADAKERFFDGLEQVTRNVAPGDVFVFYIAGHGGTPIVLGAQDEQSLSPRDEFIALRLQTLSHPPSCR